MFRSTLPRGERPPASGDELSLGVVSIHAPARAATAVLEGAVGLVEVSIHAPARGATHRLINFRNAARVSIHAPVRGATRHHANGCLC